MYNLSFGLVRYIACFLPQLADFTHILTPLTAKEACHKFPTWTTEHNTAFKGIIPLVISHECLTTIDHNNLGDNKMYVTCDASNWHMGATLSCGPSWESA